MSTGYSLHVRDLNEQADERNIGVRLGRVCIARKVPVSDVARQLGVSRATVYNWFCGASAPQDSSTGRIEALIAALE